MARLLVLSVLLLLGGALHAQPSTGGPLEGLARLKDYETQRSSSSDPNWRNGNGDARPIPPGQTLTIADLQGPGEIAHIWFTIAARERGYPRLLVLRMYWDGEKNPSVECPIGDFFGVGHGLDVPFDSLPVRVTSNGRGRNCYWPMPFRRSARITVANEGRQPTDAFYYYVDWRRYPRMRRDTAYFHAAYRQEHPTVMGRNYLIADIVGRGHYVGTVLSCRQRTPSWWGEGDDFFFVDGEREPRLRGTGTEDYFCDGWGFVKQAGPFYGAPLMEGYETGNRTTVYRWHLTDPVTFRQSLRVEIEHKGVALNADGSVRSGFEERADDFSSVAFWYQVEPHKPFGPMPAAYARLYYDFSKATEGESLVERATATDGPIQRQELGGWSGNAQLFWTPGSGEQALTIPIEVREAGTYDVLALLTHSFDYGVFQLELDGKSMGRPVDLYSASVTEQEHLLGSWTLEAGTHTLTVRNVGKAADSRGYYFGLDAILLQRR